MQLRYFGPRPLIEDNSVRSAQTTLLSARIGYKITKNLRIAVDGFNLLDREDSQIDYFYTSRLAGEPDEGVDDIHFHPVEPRTFRAALILNFSGTFAIRDAALPGGGCNGLQILPPHFVDISNRLIAAAIFSRRFDDRASAEAKNRPLDPVRILLPNAVAANPRADMHPNYSLPRSFIRVNPRRALAMSATPSLSNIKEKR